jgi:hypothetical protein
MNTTAQLTLTNPKNGDTIQSPFATDNEAVLELRHLLDTNAIQSTEFAVSISWCLVGRGGKPAVPSPAQRFWLHKLAMPKVAQPPKATGLDMTGLRTIFASAASKLKRPAIVLRADQIDVKLSLAGPSSRYKGDVMVASPRFGDAYYGRVDAEGVYHPGRQSNPAVDALVLRMAQDPAGTAAEYGRLTGKCCFCNLPLKDDKSTAVGYGPVCAKNFNLPWGSVAVRSRKCKA